RRPRRRESRLAGRRRYLARHPPGRHQRDRSRLLQRGGRDLRVQSLVREGCSAPMRWDIFTLFPGMFAGPLSESIIRRAIERGLGDVMLHDWREQATDRHRTVDDTPYGGGAGMVLQAPPLVRAVEAALGADLGRGPVILLSPTGRPFTQRTA